MEFLEEFTQEAEELLGLINKQLLGVAEASSASARQPLLQELLRAFHTLKGLVGMMGLEPAGEICHACESALNRVRKQPQGLESRWVDSMLECSRVLGRLIHALPERPGLPEARASLERLHSLDQPQHWAAPVGQMELSVPEEVGRHLQEDDWSRIHQALQDGLSIGLAYFSPTPELAARDLNVNRVREHLLASGDLLKAVPLIEGSRVRFAFLCLFPAHLPPQALEGVDWEVLDTPPAAEAMPAREHPLEEIARAVSNTVRVEVSRLDEIMRLVGELVVSRWRLENALDSAGLEDNRQAPIRDSAARIERQLRELRQAVTRARMVPLSEVFGRMPLAVRDLARSSPCQVRLEMDGEETQVDKVLVERLLDPLLHLVRNALAHGLESPEERERAGKNPVGTLRLSAQPQGDSIRIEVCDDGRGLDLEAIGRATGVGSSLEANRALDILCRPGFSTRREAARDAGRGVGMDVVRTAVAEMGGHLGVENRPGQGCTFWMRLPLTLTIVDSFLVSLAGERYAVARDAVTEVVEIPLQDIQRHPGGELVTWRGGALPLVRLRQVLGSAPQGEPENPHALVYSAGTQRLAFVVDRVVGLREVVVRPLADPLLARPWLGGATELGDGSVALILDLPQLARQGARL
ncbi:chemotaxis protein CheA [bacterium]|nr:chemotaxis protein CheA [bacterium]